MPLWFDVPYIRGFTVVFPYNSFGDEAEIFRLKQVISMAVYALASYVAKASTAIILLMLDRLVLAFQKIKK